jgi:cysteamine dioxygenase
VLSVLPGLCALATRANAWEGREVAGGKLHWEAFLEAVAKEAAKQHLDAWNQDRHVETLAKLASQLHLDDPVLRQGIEQLGNRLNNRRVDFSDLEKRVDFSICLVQFDVGEVIPAHDHPGMTGMILCASGEIQTANYDEIIPDPAATQPAADHTLLRRVSQGMLRQNDIATLTAKARNIHTLKALKVTQLVDLFTPPYDEERIAKSRWFELDPQHQPGDQDLFEARIRA